MVSGRAGADEAPRLTGAAAQDWQKTHLQLPGSAAGDRYGPWINVATAARIRARASSAAWSVPTAESIRDSWAVNSFPGRT